MEQLVGQAEAFRDPAAMAARVTADATRAFGAAEAATLARYAREAVAELWTDGIRVTSFVPVLALRAVRERLDAAAPPTDRPVLPPAPRAPRRPAAGGLTDTDVLTDPDTLTPD